MPEAKRASQAEEEPDDDLLFAIKCQDRQAFAQFADRHTLRLYRLALRYCGDQATTDEIVQETLFRIWTRAGQWDRGRGTAQSWTNRILVNLCIDQGRRKKPTVDVEDIVEPAYTGPDAHQLLASAQLEKGIREAIAALPDRQRAAVALCFDQDIGCREGAQILGISVQAMESLLLRGRRSIRKRLNELGLLTDNA